MLPDNEKELAPLETVLLVAIYSKITILPSDKEAPFTPSPK